MGKQIEGQMELEEYLRIPDMNSEKDIRLLVRYVLQEESRLQRIGWSLKSARQTLRNCGIDWHDPKWQKKKKRTRKVA